MHATYLPLQLIEQQWQIAVTNVHRTEMQPKCIPSYPTVALATHKDNVILTIGWPRHFAASVQELQEYTCDLQFNLEEMIKCVLESLPVPSGKTLQQRLIKLRFSVVIILFSTFFSHIACMHFYPVASQVAQWPLWKNHTFCQLSFFMGSKIPFYKGN